MLQSYPLFDESLVDETINAEIEWLKCIVLGIRSIRGEMNIPPNKCLAVYFRKGHDKDKLYLDRCREFLLTLARIKDITWLSPDESAPPRRYRNSRRFRNTHPLF